MIKEELKKFEELYDKFLEDCNRVTHILTNSKERTTHECCNINYAETFTLDGNYVSWEGDEYWQFQGHEHHSGYFPVEFLTMSDDELMKIVDKENKEYDKKQEAKEKEKEEREKAARLEQYNKLKEEFGK